MYSLSTSYLRQFSRVSFISSFLKKIAKKIMSDTWVSLKGKSSTVIC